MDRRPVSRNEYVFRLGGREYVVHANSASDGFDLACVEAEQRGLTSAPTLIDSYPWDPSGGDGPDD